MSKSKNTKVSRLLDAMAVTLCDLPDETVKELHATINDDRDGYEFDFVSAINGYRHLTVGSIKPSVI